MDLTPALDAAILRTLAKIRNKRGVYEGEDVLADELKEAEEKVIKAGIKAMPNRREEIKVCTTLSSACKGLEMYADTGCRDIHWRIIIELRCSMGKRTLTRKTIQSH